MNSSTGKNLHKLNARLTLTRPLVFFNLEITGTDTVNDRIVEISLVKLYPVSREEINTFRINPGIPIPPEASAIHGIRDEDVKDKPTFSALVHIIINTMTYDNIVNMLIEWYIILQKRGKYAKKKPIQNIS